MAEKERVFPIERTPEGGYRLRELLCWDCGGTYTLPFSGHLKGPRHQDWIRRAQTTLVPEEAIVEEEASKPVEEGRLVFGDVRVCPRCRGTLRPERKDRKGNVLPADTYTHDPIDKDGRCVKCKGTGVVQAR